MRRNRLICFLTALCILVGILPGPNAFAAVPTTDVNTVFEAEKCEMSDDAAAEKDKSASGSKYVVVYASGRCDDPSVLKQPDLSVKVKIPADGIYTMYVRMYTASDSVDSLHFWWDDVASSAVSHPGASGNWKWVSLGTATLTAGTHTFNMTRREPGAYWDCIYIADSSSTPPEVGGEIKVEEPEATPTPKPVTSKPSKAPVYETKEGSVLFEAEDGVVSEDFAATEKNDSCSGKKAVIFQAEIKDPQPTAADNGALEYNIKADEDATYFIWARVLSKDGGSDSFWLSLKGGEYAYTGVTPDSKDDNDYVWQKVGSVDIKKGETVLMRIIPREARLGFDRFAISKVLAYAPSGLGELPDEKLLGAVDEFASDKYPKPSITPPSEHPRVWFREQDLDTIRANFNLEYNAEAVRYYETSYQTEFDGIMPMPANGGASYSSAKLDIIQAKALNYALTGDKEMAKQAILAIKNAMKTTTYTGISDNTRSMGHVIRVAGMVYDWCYDELTAEDKQELVAGCQIVARGMEIGYPPSGQGAVTGHGSEAQIMKDWLCMAIACYDEYPSIYNYIAGRLLSEFIDPREYYDAASGSHHQGDSYGQGRYAASLEMQWLFYRMSGKTIFSPGFGKVPYQYLYYRRPDGQLLREGDCYSEEYSAVGLYWNSHVSTMYYAASFYHDPILLKEALLQNATNRDMIMMLLLSDPTLKAGDVKTLPLSRYFGSPNGMYIARTGWSDGIASPDVIAQMKIGETWAANHHHLDFGTFQIYYKGILASESGFYESYNTDHDLNYNKQTIAHNGLLIYDPDEKMNGNIVNSGGQRTAGGEVATYEQWMQDGKYEYGKVLAHEAGPEEYAPEYTYISGDITKAYSDKVSEVVRSMIFMPTDNKDFPAVFMVMDKVTATNKNYKKTWLLHMQQEPEVSGNVSVIKRDTDGYNGKLTNQTLLPRNAQITKIGGEGQEFVINGINHPLRAPLNATNIIEEGWGRVEVSPSEANKTDYFLNVMYVSDADNTAPVNEAKLIETEDFAGAVVLDKAVLFAKDTTKYGKDFEFEIAGSDADGFDIAIAGLKAGTWEIYEDAKLIDSRVASKDGSIIYFKGGAGKYSLVYKAGSSDKKINPGKAFETEGIRIRVNKSFIYSDVEPTIVNDRTLLPMRAIFEAIGAEVSYDEATSTATAVKGSTTVKITENSTDAYVNGTKYVLDVPATIKNDRFVVPVRFVSESLGCSVAWLDAASLVTINYTEKKAPAQSTIPGALTVTDVVQSGDDGSGNDIYNSLDSDLNTRWAPEGSDYASAWGIYDLGEKKTIDKVMLSYYNGDARTYFFTIQVSDDKENWTTVIEKASSSGTTNELEEYSMNGASGRYVRYLGGGNSTNAWNSVTEIVFIEKK